MTDKSQGPADVTVRRATGGVPSRLCFATGQGCTRACAPGQRCQQARVTILNNPDTTTAAPASGKITPDGGGLRYNKGKPRHSLLPVEWTDGLAQQMTVGAEKYAPRNWERGMDPEFMLDSFSRHIAAYRRGERYDEETGMHHLIAAAWNILSLFSYDVRGLVRPEFFAVPLAAPISIPKSINNG